MTACDHIVGFVRGNSQWDEPDCLALASSYAPDECDEEFKFCPKCGESLDFPATRRSHLVTPDSFIESPNAPIFSKVAL